MNAAKLKLFLECPVCLSIPRQKILVCTNGHKICESCHTKVMVDSRLCPQGRCSYTHPPQRNRDLEAIVENSNLPFNCSIPQCQAEMARDELPAHEAECNFRKVPCPDSECKDLIRFKDIFTHIQHRLRYPDVLPDVPGGPFYSLNFKVGFYSTAPGTGDDWGACCLEYDKTLFYPQFVRRGPYWYFWIKINGGPQMASEWMFSAKVENKDTGIRMEFSGSVLPIDYTVEQVIEDGDDFLQINSTTIEKLPRVIEIVFKVYKPSAHAGNTGDNPLAFLRNHVMFLQIRRVIQQNPNMLSTMLRQIGRSEPQLLQVIDQNQEAFIRMINDGEAGEEGEGGIPM